MNANTMPTSAQPRQDDAPASVPVWDVFVRVFHWTLVVSFFTAWMFTEHIGWLHKSAGYLALGLVVMRVVWGFVGSEHARFANFVPGPKKLRTYLGLLIMAREPRHVGHNPAGAVMILFLLTAVTVIGVTGWMMTTDAFWGNGLVENIHTWSVDATLGAVVVHVLANIYGSWRHKDNLIKSMITGRKAKDAQH